MNLTATIRPMLGRSESSLFARRAALLSVLAAAVLVGCAAPPPVLPEVAVRERAIQRWQALLAGKFENAYNLLAPSYRALTPLKRYEDSIGGAAVWTGAEVVTVKCNETRDNCTALVRISAKPLLGARMGPEMSTHVDETWVKQQDQWWFVPRT